MGNIPVLEIFGPTIQGEGKWVGQKTMFVRTAGCDYRCSWCDSAFTWDGSEKENIVKMSGEEVVESLRKLGGTRFNHVTLSGGNPVLISGLGEVVQLLHEQGVRVAVETQGSVWTEWLKEVDEITLSPKPPSSTMKVNIEKLDEIVEQLKENEVIMKVVIFTEEDYAFAKDLHMRYPKIPFVLQVGNDDSNTGDNLTLQQQLLNKYEWLIEKVSEDEKFVDVRVLPQLHTLIWGNKRGV